MNSLHRARARHRSALRSIGASLLFPLAATLQAADAPASPEPLPEPSTEIQNTIITSERAEGRNSGVEAYFVFDENVHLTGTNLDVTCDKLEIWADSTPGEKKIGGAGPIRRVLATGSVVIRQFGRKATAGRVEILPAEDVVILTENPVVTDATGTYAGERIRFFRGEQKLYIDKPRIEGAPLPNMGFSKQPPAAETPAPPAPAP
jgi:lipopolysaccharide export system protein LptA